MTDFLANNIDALEALFINPTMSVDTSVESIERMSVMSLEMQKFRFDDFDSDHLKAQDAEDFFTHNFASRYSSEEEAASPHDSADSLSLHSEDLEIVEASVVAPQNDSSLTVEELFLRPEQLASTCVKIEHRCNKAQAVVLVTAGKPKVVSVPKIVDGGSPKRIRPSLERPSLESRRTASTSSRPGSRRSIRPSLEAVCRVSRVPEEDVSEDGSISLASTKKPGSSGSSTTKGSRAQSLHQPSVPLLRAAAAFDPYSRIGDIVIHSAPVPPSPPRRTLIKRSHTHTAAIDTAIAIDHNEQLPLLSYETPTKRRLQRLASSLSLGSAGGLMRRKGSLASLRKPSGLAPSLDSIPKRSEVSTPITPAAPVPARRSSMGKLTPRGPTERAPIIVLPPCPDDDEDDDFMSVTPVDAVQTWDRSRARRIAKANKARPSIDDIVARLL